MGNAFTAEANAAGGLFLDPIREETRATYPKTGACEGRLGGGHQPVSLLHPVDVVDGEAAAFGEVGQEQRGQIQPEPASQSLRLGREVTAQGEVVAADGQIGRPARRAASGDLGGQEASQVDGGVAAQAASWSGDGPGITGSQEAIEVFRMRAVQHVHAGD